MFPPVFLALCVLVLALCGCERTSGDTHTSQGKSDRSRGVETSPALTAHQRELQARMAHVPLDADMVIAFEKASLLQLSQTPWMADLHRRLLQPPATSSPLAMCEASLATLGASLCQHGELHQALLLDVDAPLHVVRSKGHWLFLFDHTTHTSAPRSFGAWSERLARLGLTLRSALSPERAAFLELDTSSSSFKVASLHASTDGDAPAMASWMRSDSLSILIVPTRASRLHPSELPSGIEVARAIASLEPARSWRARPAHRSMQDAMVRAGDEIAILWRGELITEALKPNNDAARQQRDALSRQLDLIGLSLSRSARSDAQIKGQVFVSSTEQEPIFLDALDPAPSTLDADLGVLLDVEASGIFHLAASPQSLLQTLRGALDLSQRQQLDHYLTYLKDELLLDVEQAIVDNLTGHFLLIIYEPDLDALRQARLASKARSTREDEESDEDEDAEARDEDAETPDGRLSQPHDLFGLSSTHEALYMPLKDSFAMEQFLNALTQITRGRMRRQRVDEVIQYVLLEDGELQGAFLLGEHALLWVDSSVAVEQGMRHLKSPRPLSPSQRERFGDLLKGRQGFGMWCDPGHYIDALPASSSQTSSGALVRALSDIKDFRLTSYAFKRALEGEERPSFEGIMPGHESASFSFSLAEGSPDEATSSHESSSHDP